MTEGKLIDRKHYKYFVPITTRWMDNDIYGHVNNVAYYSYFDTAANHYLIEEGRLDIHNAPVVGFVVHSNCNYLSPIAYPDKIEAGICVKKIGNSSVTYGIGIFKKGEDAVCAHGELVHVFVDRKKSKSVSTPIDIREALEKILIN